MRSNRVLPPEQARRLDLSSRIRLEAGLTDAEKPTESREIEADFRFADYRDRSPWRRHLFDFLGPLEGRTVLDVGCGYHPTPVYFALAGAARVLACDVSPKALAFTAELAERAGMSDRVVLLKAPAEELPIRSGTVDLIHGEAVLHHLALPRAGAELARVLRPGGRAAFKDPLGQNPLLEFARDHLPYRWKKHAKGTDRPLRFEDVEEFGKAFRNCSYRGFGLLSIAAAVLSGRSPSALRRLADAADERLLPVVPALERYGRFVVTCVEK